MADENSVQRGVRIRAEILEFIKKYIREHGYPPTVREIGEGVDLQSSSSVHSHLLKMFNDGMLETDAKPGAPRAIRVPGFKVDFGE